MGYKEYSRSPELFKSNCEAYFLNCDSVNAEKLKKPYTISGLCLYLGISRSELDKLSKKKTLSVICKEISLKIESFIEENALLGALANNPALYSLKYNFGWTDKPFKANESDESKAVKISLDGECEKWAN